MGPGARKFVKHPDQTPDKNANNRIDHFQVISAKFDTPVFVGLILLLTAAVYGNSLSNGFVYDDVSTIVQNPHIGKLGNLLTSLCDRSYFEVSGGEASYRPVATLSYFLLYAAFGLNSFGYHLFSVVLHAFNACLVYFLASVVLKGQSRALVAALLFCCHPAISEAVNCISYNEDLLAGCFYLSSLLVYVKAARAHHRSANRRILLSLFLFFLGLLSKEMAITLPAVILLHDTFIARSGSEVSLRATVDEKKSAYAGYVAVGLVYLCIRFILLTKSGTRPSPAYGSLVERIIYLPNHLVDFLKLALFPFNLKADHVFRYPGSFWEAENVISWLIVAALILCCLRYRQRAAALCLGIAWFLVTLLPVSNLIQIFNPFAERYLYIPLVGFCLAAAFLMDLLAERLAGGNLRARTLWRVGIAMGIVGVFAAVTISRNTVWKDSYTLWSRTVKDSPDSFVAHGGLGRALQERGRLEEAIAEYRRAIQLNPREFKARYNLGTIYEGQENLNAAAEEYLSAIEHNPMFGDAYFNLASIYVRRKSIDEAIRLYERLIELEPKDFEARNNLGVLYAQTGRLSQALEQWEQVLKIDPQNPNAAENIRRAKEMIGQGSNMSRGD